MATLNPGNDNFHHQPRRRTAVHATEWQRQRMAALIKGYKNGRALVSYIDAPQHGRATTQLSLKNAAPKTNEGQI